MHKHPDAETFQDEDGIWRMRIGPWELWLDPIAAGRICFGYQEGPSLYTGYLGDGKYEFDPVHRLYGADDN